jgi:hypothetical protein
MTRVAIRVKAAIRTTLAIRATVPIRIASPRGTSRTPTGSRCARSALTAGGTDDDVAAMDLESMARPVELAVVASAEQRRVVQREAAVSRIGRVTVGNVAPGGRSVTAIPDAATVSHEQPTPEPDGDMARRR